MATISYPIFTGEWSVYKQVAEPSTARFEIAVADNTVTLSNSGPGLADNAPEANVVAADTIALTNVELLCEFTLTGDGDFGAGFGLCARLPGAEAAGYTLRWHRSAGATWLLRAQGKVSFGEAGNTFDNVSASAMVVGTAYRMRFVVLEEPTQTVLRGRIWAAADAEPGTWAIDTVANLINVGYIGTAGAVGVANLGITGNWGDFERAYVVSLFEVTSDEIPADPGAPGGIAAQSPLDRYRSGISADAGSLLATTRAVPFDTSHTIAFSPAGELSQDALYPFHEAPSVQSGTPDVMFYPRARQSIDGPVVYDGVTTLTLMERVFPAQILTTTFDAGIGITGSAQEIIDYVFTQWAAEFAWFTYAVVPDLRLRDVSINGDWNTDVALARTLLKDRVIRVLQSPTSPRSMRAMLEDLLSPFPGTQFFMDSAGDLVIRPVYGPDADATAYKTLATSDVVTISIGEPSVDQVVNRCTVSFQRYTQAADVSVLEPAYVQVASNYLRDASFSPGPPVSTYLYTPPGDRLDVSTDDADFGGWRSIPLGEGIILGADPIALEDTGGLLVTAEVKTFDSAGTLDESWTSPGDLTVEVFNTVPLDGSTVLAFGVRRGASYGGNTYHGRWNARWNGTTKALEIQWAGGGLEVNTFTLATQRVAVMGVTINGVSAAWAEGATINATFGVVADGDFVPGPGDTNALATSVTAFGVLEERFTIQGYGTLTAAQLERIAEAYVMQNLEPRATRELALGWKGAVGVEFDDRGRLLAFPNSAEGLLTGMRYADDFISGAGAKTITIEETVPGSPGSIDFDAVLLLNEDGSFWTNEDGSPSTPA